MKGFRYVNNSAKLASCTELADEICNSGPLVWGELIDNYWKCPKPCKFISYSQLSHVEFAVEEYRKVTKNQAMIALVNARTRRIETELLVYDTTDMIGAIHRWILRTFPWIFLF